MTPFPSQNLKLEEKAPSKRTLIIYLRPQHNIPEDVDVQQNRCQHLKSRITSADVHNGIRSILKVSPLPSAAISERLSPNLNLDRTQDLHNMSPR